MNASVKCQVLAVLGVLVGGCLHVRTAARVDVPGPHRSITTQNRYSVIWRSGGQNVNCTKLLGLHQPNVFAEDGIPVEVTVSDAQSSTYGLSEGAKGLQLLCYICSLGISPFFVGSETDESVTVGIHPAVTRETRRLSVSTRRDAALSLLPIAFCLYPSQTPYPPTTASCVYCEHTYDFVEAGYVIWNADNGAWTYEAKAYGLACRLKEMEEAGEIAKAKVDQYRMDRRKTDIVKRRTVEKVKQDRTIARTMQRPPAGNARQAPYRLVYLERERDCGFAYRFALELNGEPSVQTFFGIQNIFADEVRTAYQLEFPNADVTSLRIAVRPKLINGKIEGRAVVLTITPVSLVYDPLTRKGKISVKFDENQYAEAREWARKNIETLVRDKNIVIETGELPPPGRYLSGSELVADTLQGKVLEMEFKAE